MQPIKRKTVVELWTGPGSSQDWRNERDTRVYGCVDGIDRIDGVSKVSFNFLNTLRVYRSCIYILTYIVKSCPHKFLVGLISGWGGMGLDGVSKVSFNFLDTFWEFRTCIYTLFVHIIVTLFRVPPDKKTLILKNVIISVVLQFSHILYKRHHNLFSTKKNV